MRLDLRVSIIFSVGTHAADASNTVWIMVYRACHATRQARRGFQRGFFIEAKKCAAESPLESEKSSTIVALSTPPEMPR